MTNNLDDVNTLALKLLAVEQKLLDVEAKLVKPKRKRKCTSVTANLSPEQLEWVVTESLRRNISRAELIRVALIYYATPCRPKGFAKRSTSPAEETLEF